MAKSVSEYREIGKKRDGGRLDASFTVEAALVMSALFLFIASLITGVFDIHARWSLLPWDGNPNATVVDVNGIKYMKAYYDASGNTVYINDNIIDGTNLRPVNLANIGGTATPTHQIRPLYVSYLFSSETAVKWDSI